MNGFVIALSAWAPYPGLELAGGVVDGSGGTVVVLSPPPGPTGVVSDAGTVVPIGWEAPGESW